MLAAILNIIGGLGLLAFLLVMLLRGGWVRQGWNRALPLALFLASLATVTLASSLEHHAARARNLGVIAGLCYALAVICVALWWHRSKQRRSA